MQLAKVISVPIPLYQVAINHNPYHVTLWAKHWYVILYTIHRQKIISKEKRINLTWPTNDKNSRMISTQMIPRYYKNIILFLTACRLISFGHNTYPLMYHLVNEVLLHTFHSYCIFSIHTYFCHQVFQIEKSGFHICL